MLQNALYPIPFFMGRSVKALMTPARITSLRSPFCMQLAQVAVVKRRISPA